MSKLTKTFIFAFVVCLTYALLWLSKSIERDFIRGVNSKIKSGEQVLDISHLVPGKWKTVCNINGYDGSQFIEKYGKSYGPAGDMQDGAWGIVFINSDGSSFSISGSRLDGFDCDFGCMESDNAKVKIRPKTFGPTLVDISQ